MSQIKVFLESRLSGCRLACFTILLSHLAILAHCAHTKFPNVDELAHLPAGISHWKFERFDLYRVNPPLVRLFGGFAGWLSEQEYNWNLYSGEPGRRTEFNIGLDAVEHEGVSHVRRFFLPRMISLIFSLVGCLTLVIWFSRSISRFAGVVACLLWCASPDMLAHGYTIGPDVGSVAAMVLSCVACHYFILDANIRSATIFGLTLGAALSTKLTMLTLIFTLPCFCLFYSFFISPIHRNLLRIVLLLSFSILIAFTALNTCYLFEGFGTRLGDYRFVSNALGGKDDGILSLKNRFNESIFGSIPIPLPKNYIYGIDWLKMEVEQGRWSFLLGEWKFGSWWYYYIFTTCTKTPEFLFLGCLVGMLLILCGVCCNRCSSRELLPVLILGVAGIPIFISVSLQGGFNHHHRYILPLYPFLFALFAYNCSPFVSKIARFGSINFHSMRCSIPVPFAFVISICYSLSSLSVHPHYLSYFNSISGGPGSGWKYLGFSNIDWGQDILEVDQWIKSNHNKRPLVMDIDYFGMSGDLFDVATSSPPQLPKGASINEVRKSLSETQWWIISVKKLYNLPGHDGLEYLQQIEPVEKIAYCYHVYRIDPLPADESSN